MKAHFLGILLYGFIGISSAFGQDVNVSSNSKLTISRSFESTDEMREPAVASLTIPADEPSSFLINAGIGYKFTYTTIRKSGAYDSFSSYTPFIVGNYNSFIADKQRSYKIGGNYSHLIGKNEVTTMMIGDSIIVTGRNYFTFNHTIEYVRDIEKPTHSVVYVMYFTQNKNTMKKGGLYINEYQGEKRWQTFVGYNIGLEYQQRFWADQVSNKGFTLRNYHNGILRLAMRARDKAIKAAYVPFTEVAVNYTGRFEMARSTAHKEGYLPLFKTELITYPTQRDNFSLGFSYNAGSDPLNGLLNQHYYMLALNFKVN